MAASSREEIVERFDAFRDAVCDLLELSFDVLTAPERLDLLERLEQDTSRLPVARHALIIGVRQQATAAEIGASWRTWWPTGCPSPAPTPPGASRKPRTSASAKP